MVKTKIDYILGVFIMIINSIWILKNVYFLYMYNFAGRLWLFMIPNWILMLNTFLALLGLFIGFKLKYSNLQLWKGITLSILLIILGVIIELKIITEGDPFPLVLLNK